LHRSGDEIMVAGQLFHTGTRVILWTEPRGYDAYRVERHFGPYAESSWTATTQQSPGFGQPNRLELRSKVLSEAEIEQVRTRGWTLPLLQQKVDQFVIHYDASGTSRECFRTLHDVRDLSVHFLLDLDGTIYQTCDLKEACWHATKANHRSIGIEIANIGAMQSTTTMAQWYQKDERGRMRITIPQRLGDAGIRNQRIILRPARDELITGPIHGVLYQQYDFTPQQYRALERLVATVCTVLPRIDCDCPRDENGRPTTTVMPDAQWQNYHGLLGHYHVQENKQDPGPAFRWDAVISNARKLMPVK
jgi:N-acetyl-anhydromuramyl-L-alanine amidase AmpD